MGERERSAREAIDGDRRWNEADARRVLAMWRRSGLSMHAFARRHGLNDQRVSWWRKRLETWAGEPAGSGAARLVPVEVHEAKARTSDGRVTGAVVVRLPGGVALELCDGTETSPRWIAALAAELTRSA